MLIHQMQALLERVREATACHELSYAVCRGLDNNSKKEMSGVVVRAFPTAVDSGEGLELLFLEGDEYLDNTEKFENYLIEEINSYTLAYIRNLYIAQ